MRWYTAAAQDCQLGAGGGGSRAFGSAERCRPSRPYSSFSATTCDGGNSQFGRRPSAHSLAGDWTAECMMCFRVKSVHALPSGPCTFSVLGLRQWLASGVRAWAYGTALGARERRQLASPSRSTLHTSAAAMATACIADNMFFPPTWTSGACFCWQPLN
jgi:hypothetical protein